MKTPLSFWWLVYFLSQFYQKGGVFSLKNPLKSRLFSIYFGAKVEYLTIIFFNFEKPKEDLDNLLLV
jgi:hypothetical protein